MVRTMVGFCALRESWGCSASLGVSAPQTPRSLGESAPRTSCQGGSASPGLAFGQRQYKIHCQSPRGWRWGLLTLPPAQGIPLCLCSMSQFLNDCHFRKQLDWTFTVCCLLFCMHLCFFFRGPAIKGTILLVTKVNSDGY